MNGPPRHRRPGPARGADRPPCETAARDLWFADEPDDIAAAQRLCRGCPVRTPCLAGALERGEPWGIWGGEIFHGGVVVAAKPRPGRPRKQPSAA